jgi:ferredoxin
MAKPELEALKAQAQAMSRRLQEIYEKIERIESGSASHRPKAVVDTEKCTACGLCRDVCPARAVTLGGTAVIDRAACIGCGKCVAECPRGVLMLKRA